MADTTLSYEELQPKNIEAMSELALPWSRAQWRRIRPGD